MCGCSSFLGFFLSGFDIYVWRCPHNSHFDEWSEFNCTNESSLGSCQLLWCISSQQVIIVICFYSFLPNKSLGQDKNTRNTQKVIPYIYFHRSYKTQPVLPADLRICWLYPLVVSEHSRGLPEGSLFNSYYTGV